MKKILFVLAALFLSSNAWAACAGSNPNWTSTIDQASVQTCANNAASGSTITVASGTTSWSSSVTWSGKALKFQGQTTCTGGKNGTCNDLTDITVTASNANGFVGNGDSTTNFCEITGFTLRESVASGNGIIEIDGVAASQNSCRVHHNHIIASGGPSRGIIPNNIFMLIDNNKFDGTAGGSIQFISVQGSGPGTDGGYTPWMIPNTLGTNNNVFIEDNSFTSNSPESVIDCYTGGHLVIRNNGFHNSNWGFHGTDSGNNRSCAYFEIYNNDFDNTGGAIRIGNARGGTGVIYNNHILNGSYTGVALQLYRACPRDGSDTSGWGTLNGTNYAVGSTSFSAQASRDTHPTTGAPSSTNVLFCSLDRDAVCTADSQCSSAGKGTCSGFFDGTGTNGYPGRDQPGVGHGQVLEPIYAWNNDFSLGSDDGPGTCSPSNKVSGTLVVLNRDYFTGSTAKPGYTPFTYPHPLQGASLPQVSAPTCSPSFGTYGSTQTATCSSVTPGTTTCYTTNNSTPVTNGAGSCTAPTLTFSSSLGISTTTTLKLVATKSGNTDSSVTTGTYTISAGAQTYFVNKAGACADLSTQPGTLAQPFCTITYGNTRMNGGDTLIVKAGTYDGGFTITGPSGTSSAHTVFKVATGETVVLDNGSINSGRIKISHGCSWIDFIGFTITNHNQGLYLDDDAGTDVACTNVTVDGITVFGVGQEGIAVRAGAGGAAPRGFIIKNSTIHDTGLLAPGQNGEGIYVGSSSGTDTTNGVTLLNNTIFNTSAEGIELKGDSHDVIVDGNNISNCITSNSQFGNNGGCIEVDEPRNSVTSANHIIRNNVVHDVNITSGATKRALRFGNGVTAYNNIVYNVDPTYTCLLSNSTNFARLIYHNTIDCPSTSIVDSASSDIRNNIGPNTANNIGISSSFFSGYAAHNYHLVNGAAPIRAGVNLNSIAPTDKDGLARSNPPDLGAFQFTVTINRVVGHTVGGGRIVH